MLKIGFVDLHKTDDGPKYIAPEEFVTLPGIELLGWLPPRYPASGLVSTSVSVTVRLDENGVPIRVEAKRHFTGP